jgi:hypoxanthine phosphoribosyltransferase
MQDVSRFPLYESLLASTDLLAETADFVKKVMSLDPDTIFFLDKSTRPIAYMLLQILRKLSHKMPAIRYINIGRETGKKPGAFKGDPNIVRKVYGRYINPKGRILIVDEHSCTGKTIELASQIISEAFPEARVEGTSVYSRLPPWYGELWYLGVRDPMFVDYEQMALEIFNKRTGNGYKTLEEIPEEMLPTFDKIYHGILGTMPYTKRFEPAQFYQYYNYNPEICNCTAARHNLREMCEIILQHYF